MPPTAISTQPLDQDAVETGTRAGSSALALKPWQAFGNIQTWHAAHSSQELSNPKTWEIPSPGLERHNLALWMFDSLELLVDQPESACQGI